MNVREERGTDVRTRAKSRSAEWLLLLIALLIVVLSAIVSYRAGSAFDRHNQRVTATREVMTAVDGLLSSLTDAETGQRGYLLTGEDRYLEPYRQALERIPANLETLARTERAPDQTQRIERLKSLIKVKLDELQKTIDLRKNAGLQAALPEVLTDRGKVAMDQLRELGAEIHASTGNLLAQEIAARQASSDLLALTTTIGSASLFVMLIFSIVTIRRTAQRRRRLIEDLRQTGEENRKARDLMTRAFGQLLESAPDAILELDQSGRIVVLNRMAEQLFGYTREELLGQGVDILVPESLRAAHQHHRAQYIAQPVTRPMGAGLKLEARRKDGSRFPVEISLSSVKPETEFRVTAIIRDITERKQMEDQLRTVQEKYIAELELRSRESERANQLKTEFLANVSHELRSPLHTIMGFSELLEEETAGPLNAKQKRFLGHIHNDSEHLLELINDLLDLSKIEAGRLELRREVVDVAAVVAEALSSVQQRAEAKSLEIRTEMSVSTGAYADRLRFKQILHNLLTNAIKFTPAGGQIRIQAAPRDGFAAISVSDTGIGIPEDQQHAIFERFYQVQAATKGGSQGTGLGLAITKRLVDQHGGRIWTESRPGIGSCFTFTIPLEDSF